MDEQEAKEWRFCLGEAIFQTRSQRSLTQEFIATQLGIDRKTLSRVENGQNAIGIDHLWQIARVLNVKIGDLEQLADQFFIEKQQQSPQ